MLVSANRSPEREIILCLSVFLCFMTRDSIDRKQTDTELKEQSLDRMREGDMVTIACAD